MNQSGFDDHRGRSSSCLELPDFRRIQVQERRIEICGTPLDIIILFQRTPPRRCAVDATSAVVAEKYLVVESDEVK